jgi:hypothetical protein
MLAEGRWCPYQRVGTGAHTSASARWISSSAGNHGRRRSVSPLRWREVVPRAYVPFDCHARGACNLALIDSNVTAVVAVAISLLLEGFAVVVVITLVRLARNSARHRRQRTPPAIPAP